MADKESAEQGQPMNPGEMLQQVDKQVKSNKFILSSVLVVLAIVVSVMATGMTVMFVKLTDLSAAVAEAEDDSMDEQFVALEKQLLLLADYRKSELKKITAYTKQLEKISSVCDLEKAEPYRKFLTSREKDYQDFIAAMKNGTNSLAGMSRGEKKWLQEYNKQMAKLLQQSKSRQQELSQLKGLASK